MSVKSNVTVPLGRWCIQNLLVRRLVAAQGHLSHSYSLLVEVPFPRSRYSISVLAEVYHRVSFCSCVLISSAFCSARREVRRCFSYFVVVTLFRVWTMESHRRTSLHSATPIL